MQADPFAQFKAVQREGWALLIPLEVFTTPAAAKLVEFARVQRGDKLLDAACGTGVVAVTAARVGAQVKARIGRERQRFAIDVTACRGANWAIEFVDARLDAGGRPRDRELLG